MTIISTSRGCWCGNADLLSFGPEYGECRACGTLVYLKDMPPEQLLVRDDETDFYGKKYWLEHQQDAFGYTDIHARARNDLTERNLHWLKTLLKYCLPPSKVLELGCSHGSFVALLRQAGYDASGVEMSPWVVEFGRKIFGVPVAVGPVEILDIAPGSLDVIALMDVLEHLPDPAATMAHCLKLLKPDGLLLVQTPQFREGMNYTALVETKGAFLEQLKADEHLYLFSDRSVTRLFQQLGAEHIQFEPAIFGHYDMFLAVSRLPLATHSTKEIEASLTASPQGRLALALLDIYERDESECATLAQLEADKAYLVAQLQACETDRAALVAQLQACETDRAALVAQLQACETDRAARLKVIEAQGRQLERINELEGEKDQLATQMRDCEADRASLYANKWVTIGLKAGLISTKRK